MPYQFIFHTSFRHYAIILLTFSIVTATGCASKQPVYQDELTAITSAVTKESLSEERGWWRVAIRIKSVEETEEETEVEILWHVDLFLAHSVMAPIIRKNSEDITLWRFHRRAMPDADGHQFSLALYTSAQTAKNIFEEIAGSTLLEKAKTSGFIISESFDDTSVVTYPAISDTSDGDWSTITQKAWPYYIMGASQMWLAMIDDIIKDNPPPTEDIKSISDFLDYYKEVNDVVKTLWRDEAQHAFLHHLNALFGYEPMLFYEPRLIRF